MTPDLKKPEYDCERDNPGVELRHRAGKQQQGEGLGHHGKNDDRRRGAASRPTDSTIVHDTHAQQRYRYEKLEGFPGMSPLPLSLRDCLRYAVTGMWRHPTDILRAFWPVYLLAIPYWLLDSPPWKIATGLLLSLATVPCACAWHRRIIADEPTKLTLGRPEWNFVKVEMSILILVAAALFLSMLVGVFAATILPHWGTPLFFIVPGFVATCWLVAPMLLGLPAAALGHCRSSAQLDAAATPHRVKLTVLTMLIPTVQGMAQQLFGLTGSAASVGNLVLDLLCWPLGIGILSLAYIRLGVGDMETETAQP